MKDEEEEGGGGEGRRNAWGEFFIWVVFASQSTGFLPPLPPLLRPSSMRRVYGYCRRRYWIWFRVVVIVVVTVAIVIVLVVAQLMSFSPSFLFISFLFFLWSFLSFFLSGFHSCPSFCSFWKTDGSIVGRRRRRWRRRRRRQGRWQGDDEDEVIRTVGTPITLRKDLAAKTPRCFNQSQAFSPFSTIIYRNTKTRTGQVYPLRNDVSWVREIIVHFRRNN